MCPHWISTTRRVSKTSSARGSYTFRCTMRSHSPSRTISISPISAITSPLRKATIARTKAGGQVNGVDTAIVQSSTQGGFSGGNNGGGGTSSGSGAAGAGGIVTSTLGAGTTVPSFDPFLNFKGYVDHTVLQEGNAFQTGVLTFKENTIQALANFSQNFPLGTGLQINYQGQRFANNSPYEAINPTLNASFQVILTQQLLAGFGIATNERYMHIAKKNIAD